MEEREYGGWGGVSFPTEFSQRYPLNGILSTDFSQRTSPNGRLPTAPLIVGGASSSSFAAWGLTQTASPVALSYQYSTNAFSTFLLASAPTACGEGGVRRCAAVDEEMRGSG
jgi:hypothetical protein